MMQNGFRRIALAQGLLPERLPSRELPAAPEPCADRHPDAAAAAAASPSAGDGEPGMRVACAA